MSVVKGHNLGDREYLLLPRPLLEVGKLKSGALMLRLGGESAATVRIDLSPESPVSLPPPKGCVYLWSSTLAQSAGKEQPQNLASYQCSEKECPKPWFVNLQYLYFCYEPELMSKEQPGCLKQRICLATFL